ncbi:hypothetical protein MSG28_007693 [Choristoneura fumiferana]|uniref:Uncharacterized protein n=1 Tax=Choristoneura fumiferana TaxID=7141 RepID=A0ACC0JY21_CHOFU|nr:hypothetical protein MSG28_007693 [Choristoneura fumiferana]
MSDDFIPFNQSTPMQGKWQDRRRSSNQRFQSFQNYRFQNGNRRGNGHNNRWGNNSQRNSSYGSESNSSYTRNNKSNIDDYLHPSMLQDPWAHLRKNSYDQPLLSAECPPNEYNPGPDCRVQQGGPEPSCGGRHASAHPNYICNCWCAPGLLRDLDSGKCVEKC